MELCGQSRWDKKLLKFNILGRETMNVRVHTHQGEVLCSRTILGASGSVSSLEEINCLIGSLITKARKQNLWVKSIEVAHTHKSHKTRKNEYLVGELSPRDYQCANYLKRQFNFPLSMRIVSSMGFSMTQQF